MVIQVLCSLPGLIQSLAPLLSVKGLRSAVMVYCVESLWSNHHGGTGHHVLWREGGIQRGDCTLPAFQGKPSCKISVSGYLLHHSNQRSPSNDQNTHATTPCLSRAVPSSIPAGPCSTRPGAPAQSGSPSLQRAIETRFTDCNPMTDSRLPQRSFECEDRWGLALS